VHVQLHQQKGMISLSPPTICNSADKTLLTVSSRIIVRLTPSACFLLKECRKIIAYWPPLS
ncbi:hypothetical protein, partial [Klebsiella quasipneumoniae]|uniref:hypothetical protein n=1 Tax=Klebsiella quasipneumoniae TaxID=1463165 RepID=UPI003976DF60